MSRWRSGQLVAAAAGVVLAVSASAPWYVQDTTGRPALPAGASGTQSLALTALLAVGLLVVALMRSRWTALVCFGASFTLALVLLTAGLPAHVSGFRPGYGLFALGAGSVLATIGGVLNAIEEEDT